MTMSPRARVGTRALLDPGQEAFAVDRPVEHAGRVDAVVTQRGEKRHRLPMAVRHLRLQAFATATPAAQRRHVGLGPGLVDEDEPADVEARLQSLPAGASARDVRPILLAGVNGFF